MEMRTEISVHTYTANTHILSLQSAHGNHILKDAQSFYKPLQMVHMGPDMCLACILFK